MLGWELRERRRASGLTLAAVARAAGTAASNLSAYELGTKRPNARTSDRLLAVIGAGAASDIHVHQLLTVPAAAALLRQGLKAGWTTADLLRVVRQMRTDASGAVTESDQTAFFAQPATTGDQRWDLMLAGAVEDLALRNERPPPPWTRSGVLPTFWFVNSVRGLDAYTFARSPLPLQVRGVMVDAADLEAV